MNAQLKELWEKTLNIIKGELTEVSYNTWIKCIIPISIDGDSFKLSVPNDFTKGILDTRYKDLIVNALKIVTSKGYNVSFYINMEEVSTTQNNNLNKKENKTFILLYLFIYMFAINLYLANLEQG